MHPSSTLNTVGKVYLAAVYAVIIATAAVTNLVPEIKLGSARNN